jgi:hypothetical protein
LIHPDIAEATDTAGGFRAAPAEQRLDAGHQFGQVERLGQTVVRPPTQAGDLLRDAAAGGQHQNRLLEAAAAQGPADIQSVPARQHAVQKQQVEAAAGGPRQTRFVVGNGLHRVPLFPHSAGQ